jgi:putative MATE family efflux protein
MSGLGPAIRAVWRLALPVIGANLLTTLVNVVDVFFAGRLGPTEVAAVGLATTVRLLLLVVVMAVSSGAMALAAQARGSRDPEALATVARQTVLAAAALGLVLTLAGLLLSRPVIGFLDASDDPRAAAIAVPYLLILFSGTIFVSVQIAGASLLQGAGDTVRPLLLSALATTANVLFTWWLVFGVGPFPALGVPGAAVGTIAARALAMLATLWLLARGTSPVGFGRGSWRPSATAWRDILAIGWPSGLQSLAYSAAGLLVMRIVTSTASGSLGAAALAIGLQVESLAFMPGLAVSVAATSLVGRALGAWQVPEARRAGHAALAVGVAVMSGVALVLFVAAEPLVRAFDPSAHPQVLRDGVSYLRINALAQPMLAVFFVLSGALRGAGDTRPPLVGTVVGRWLVVLPLAWWWALRLEWGVVGVWWAFVVGLSVQAAFVAVRWWRGAWPGVALRRSRLYREHLVRVDDAAREAFLHDVRAVHMARPDAVERVGPAGIQYAWQGGQERWRVIGDRLERDGQEPTEGHAAGSRGRSVRVLP